MRNLRMMIIFLATGLSCTQAFAKFYYCQGLDQATNRWYFNQILSGLSEDDGVFISGAYAHYLLTQYHADLRGGLAPCLDYDSYDEAYHDQKTDFNRFPGAVYTRWEYKPPSSTPTGDEYSSWRSDRSVSNIEFRWRRAQKDGSAACELQLRNTLTDDSSRYTIGIDFVGSDSKRYTGYFRGDVRPIKFVESENVSDVISNCSTFTGISAHKRD